MEIVVEAIGNGPNPLIPKTTQGLSVTRHGTLVVDEATMMTTRKGVFAGGDIVAGASTGYAAQDYSDGRITFIDLEGDGGPASARTITGFELGARVVEGSAQP